MFLQRGVCSQAVLHKYKRSLKPLKSSVKFQQFSTAQEYTQTPQAGVDQYKQVLTRIENRKSEIAQSSHQSRKLAQKVSSEIPEDYFGRQQRYEIFINKMNQLYHNQQKWEERKQTSFDKMKMAATVSMTPLKFILQEYNTLSSSGHGFDCDTLANSLKHLKSAVEARGNQPRGLHSDYSDLSELDQSWRLSKVAEDLEFAFQKPESAYLRGQNMASISRSLGDIGYKNTDLVELWFDRLHQILKKDAVKENLTTEEQFKKAIYGSEGFKNYESRHYVYKGFESNQEFQDHVETLLSWEQQQQTVPQTMGQVQKAMTELIETVSNLKDFQIEKRAAIEAVRKQFFAIQQAKVEHDFLQENDYLKYDFLELEELLIKGGYITAEEAISGTEPNKQMAEAASIFHEHVVNYQSELLSPQYEGFIEAASKPKKVQSKQWQESFDISLEDLSSTLIGLSQQVMSYRRDALDKDYPSKKYEELLMPQERFFSHGVMGDEYNSLNIDPASREKNVLMERTYLKGWRTFMKRTENILPFVEKMVTETDKNDLNGQFRALGALSACKFSAHDLRDKIITNCKSLLEAQEVINVNSAIDGLQGLANCQYRPAETNEVVSAILAQVQDQIDEISVNKAIEMLQALYTGSFDQVNQTLVRDLFNVIDLLNIDRPYNELTYSEFQTLREIHSAAGSAGFQNKKLVSALSSSILPQMYEESYSAHYDPLKERLVGGLAAGLAKSNLHQIHTRQEMDKNLVHADNTFSPDLLLSFGGHKTGVYIVNENQVMRDTQTVDGLTAHKMRIARDHSEMKTLGIPLTKIVDYDLNSFKLELKKDFNLFSLLEEQSSRTEELIGLGELAQNMANSSLFFDQAASSPGVQSFLASLTDLLETKERDEQLYEEAEIAASKSEIRFKLLKLSLIHDTTLSQMEKDTIVSLLPQDYTSFQALVQKMKNDIVTKESGSQESSNKWLGTRMGVEIPTQSQEVQKSIETELLNRSFLWHDEYQHYSDWQKLMEETFDNFNMLIMPHKVDDQKLFFESNQHKRRIPKGIIPCPNHKRVPHKLANRLQATKTSKHDRFTTFEASPHADMISREQEVSRTQKPISDDVSMICNLQNIKQGLKSDFNDKQIAQTLLLNLDFTEQLIKEHLDNLNGKAQMEKAPKFVPRDAAVFREFSEKSAPCQNNSTFQSQFNHFYMKDALQTTKAQTFYDQIQERKANDPNADIDDLQRQMDDVLLARDRAYEDSFSLSHALENKAKITADLTSLTHNSRNVTRGVREDQMNDSDYLSYSRRVSEATLIKSKIVYKINQDLALTNNEVEYLQQWTEQASNSKESLLGHQTMIPTKSSSIRVDGLKAEDFYTLNQISGVEFTRERHGGYALNDLVVEMSHFLDQDLVRNVELTCLESKLKKEWQLGSEFKLVDKMNKEAVLVMQELEETAWKEAGRFDDADLTNIKEVISVKRRNHDKFDQAFYELDMNSLEEFVSKINASEDRIDLVENWIVRKEQELTTRVNLPSPDLQRSDAELFDQIDAPLKQAREKLASQLLTHDERGNAIARKPYSQMTTHELHLLAENLSVRLNMFYSSKRGPSDRYPAYLPQVVKAIMEHPNLANSDKNLIDTYCYLFELDWRGDREMRNQDQFMATHPIYVPNSAQKPSLDNLSANKMMHNASLPFLPALTNKMFSIAKKSE